MMSVRLSMEMHGATDDVEDFLPGIEGIVRVLKYDLHEFAVFFYFPFRQIEQVGSALVDNFSSCWQD